MKTLRISVLLVVLALLAIVASDYVGTRRAESATTPEPAEIPQNLDSKASRWTWSQSSANQRKVEIHADTVAQVRDTTLLELEGVELLIYHEDAKTYDRITCPSARFDGDTLHSDGEALVELGVRRDEAQQAENGSTRIRSSGVTFSSKSGIASTDRRAEYKFDGGSGSSTGAFYDSVNRYFRMKSGVNLEMGAKAGNGSAMKIRAGELYYFENEQRVDLKSGASLDQGRRRLEASEASVFLENGLIRKIVAMEARGSNPEDSRLVVFETPQMEAVYSAQQTLEQVTGTGRSSMKSETGSTHITASGNRIELAYYTPAGSSESLLREMYIRNSAVLEALPGPASKMAAPESRTVVSEVLHLQMKDGGEEIELVETLSRGRVELHPLTAQGSRKQLDADRIKMFYGAGSVMQTLQATGNVSVERYSSRSLGSPPLRTYSGGLVGRFDPVTGALSNLRQWTDFRFEQGDRQGQAGEAEFDLAANRTELRNAAQVWDPAGRTAADRIVLDDGSGELQALGRVSSVYQASARGGGAAASDLFSSSEPLYATAERMVSNQRTGSLEYQGRARLWQETDRIEAERIQIERRQHVLTAEGGVLTVLVEKPNNPEALARRREDGIPVEIQAAHLRYEEATRRADYNGGVRLKRGDLRITSQKLEAKLAPPETPTGRLETATAAGAVELTEKAGNSGEARRGFGQTAEYYPEAGKVVLKGDPARVLNRQRDTTQAAELTYFLDDDRLLVLGNPQERSYSLRRKRQ
jgi:lipopolysaccharide export system protein LptA